MCLDHFHHQPDNLPFEIIHVSDDAGKALELCIEDVHLHDHANIESAAGKRLNSVTP